MRGGYIHNSDIRRTCYICGEIFTITNANQRLCDDVCRRAARVRSSIKWIKANPEKQRGYRRAYIKRKKEVRNDSR